MTLEKTFEEKASDELDPVRYNARLVLERDPTRSVLFTHFLAYPKTGVSPFANDTGGLLHDVVDIPDKTLDKPSIYNRLLGKICAAVQERCPISLEGVSTVLPHEAKLPVLLEESLSFLEEVVSSNYIELKTTRVEATLSEKRVLSRQALEYAERWYRLLLIIRAFKRGDTPTAGGLCGLMSPTTNVGEWKKHVVRTL